MEIKFKKQTENYEFATFDEYDLAEDLEFCCYRLRIMNSETPLWNKKSQKFCWTSSVSKENHILYPLDFCPFCGERFTYIETADDL